MKRNVHAFPLPPDGISPLLIACQFGHSDVVNILIKGGANVNVATEVRYIHIGTL